MDQIPPASFVNKMFRIQPCPFIRASLELHPQNWIVDTETLWPTKSKNICYVNIYQNLQKWLADPWPRSSNVRAGGDVVQPAYITYEESGGRRCCDLHYHILLRCVWVTVSSPHPGDGTVLPFASSTDTSSFTVSTGHGFTAIQHCWTLLFSSLLCSL